jgi:hypothetical protein
VQPGWAVPVPCKFANLQHVIIYIYPPGEQYNNYDHALDLLEIENLNDRRSNLCEKFAKKSVKHPKFTNWFSENTEVPPNIATRGNENKVMTKYNPVQTRTKRYRDSPLPYLTDILNNDMSKEP